jgi:B12-binding domain/radical SAM domain protein
MTQCLPGAIACAQTAKEMLGDKVCVVLGGRHATESIYLSADNVVTHHSSSPLKLMAQGQIPTCFDLVVAGESEHLIARLGYIVGALEQIGASPSNASKHLEGMAEVPGKWILGWQEGGEIFALPGQGPTVDRNCLPVPCEMFGISASFEVFGGRLTAHVYSDTSCGCVYNCSFCSEKQSVCGSLSQLETGASRLFRQLQTATEVVAQDSPGRKTSAFIEDSTILAGSINGLQQLAGLLEQARLDIRFGGQLTIDQIPGREEILKRLQLVGLDYLLLGIETIDPEEIGGISKDVKRSEGSWQDRIEHALAILNGCKISSGVALLFGLGESPASRVQLFKRLKQWREKYGMPRSVSINWAVQHPLKGEDGGTQYCHYDWGIPPGPFLEAFRGFGEASVLYPIAGQPQPTLNEIWQIRQMYNDLVNI